MNSNLIKSTLASMALFVSISASAQIEMCTYGQDNAVMIIHDNVLARTSDPNIYMLDSITPTGEITTFQFNLYYAGVYSDDSTGINICKTQPNEDYDFVSNTNVINIHNLKNYITTQDSAFYCEIRTCYYDSIYGGIRSVAESKLISKPLVLRGVQFGDSIYCYDGLRFHASHLEEIDKEPSMWLVNKDNSIVEEYHVCDGTTHSSNVSFGHIFYGFEHNGMVYEIRGNIDSYGIETTPAHHISNVEEIALSTCIPLEYGTGKKIELVDGSKIKITPLKKGKHSVDFYDESEDSTPGEYVLYLYSYDEESYYENCTILGNVKKTTEGFDISNVGFIYTAGDGFDSDGVINDNGKILKDIKIANMSGRCIYYYYWCENMPFLFEHYSSLSMGLNNLSHFSNFTSTAIEFNFGMNTLGNLFKKSHD